MQTSEELERAEEAAREEAKRKENEASALDNATEATKQAENAQDKV